MGSCGHGTLKSLVSQAWIDELSCFFACWYKFMKAVSYCNKYWVGKVKSGQGLLGHRALKSGVSGERFDELS